MTSSIRRSHFVESLESRRLLSGASLHGGMLTISGDPHSTNTINVDKSPDGLAINVSVTTVNGRGISNTMTKTFPFSLGVNQIKIFGGFKDDAINVGQAVGGGLAISTTIYTNSGNNTVNCGAEDDTIIAGNGNDNINAGDGNNMVRALGGNDIIVTGSGNDRIDAGAGNDSVSSGDGNDTILGGDGNDTLDGGAGDDLIYGQGGRDNIIGGDGNDILWGGPADDSISGGNGNDTIGGVAGHNVLIGGPGQDNFVVRLLSKNPVNDYNAAEDTLTIGKSDGANPPKIV